MLSYRILCRVTIHSILTRLGADVLVGRMNRVREDERIKAVGPDSWVLPCPTPGPPALDPAFTPMYEGETEIWFDWAFVDFWKANICESRFCARDGMTKFNIISH